MKFFVIYGSSKSLPSTQENEILPSRRCDEEENKTRHIFLEELSLSRDASLEEYQIRQENKDLKELYLSKKDEYLEEYKNAEKQIENLSCLMRDKSLENGKISFNKDADLFLSDRKKPDSEYLLEITNQALSSILPKVQPETLQKLLNSKNIKEFQHKFKAICNNPEIFIDKIKLEEENIIELFKTYISIKSDGEELDSFEKKINEINKKYDQAQKNIDKKMRIRICFFVLLFIFIFFVFLFK